MARTSDRIWVGTRKGLLEVRRGEGGWSLGDMALAGQPVAYACQDPRSGSIWASIDHGHWGVKLSRSTNDGADFAEVASQSARVDARQSNDSSKAEDRELAICVELAIDPAVARHCFA